MTTITKSKNGYVVINNKPVAFPMTIVMRYKAWKPEYYFCCTFI